MLASFHFQQHIGMTPTTFPASQILSDQRIDLAIQAMASRFNISRLADEPGLSHLNFCCKLLKG